MSERMPFYIRLGPQGAAYRSDWYELDELPDVLTDRHGTHWRQVGYSSLPAEPVIPNFIRGALYMQMPFGYIPDADETVEPVPTGNAVYSPDQLLS